MALVTKFLSGIRGFVLNQDGAELRNWLKVDPSSAGSTYFELSQELKSGFPQNSKSLEQLVDRCLPEEDDVPEGKGSPWPGLNAFIKEWLEYWRDVDFNDMVKVYRRLSDLLK
jgi:nuclear mRNA export protein PCID2/THP1